MHRHLYAARRDAAAEVNKAEIYEYEGHGEAAALKPPNCIGTSKDPGEEAGTGCCAAGTAEVAILLSQAL